MNNQKRKKRNVLLIIGLLSGWAILLAIGAVVNGQEFDWRKPLFILGTIGSFLVVWLIALNSQTKE